MPERKGHRICVEVAGEIKDTVKRVLEENGRISPGLAKLLRDMARKDAQHHIKYDPSFLCGGGLAEREKSSD